MSLEHANVEGKPKHKINGEPYQLVSCLMACVIQPFPTIFKHVFQPEAVFQQYLIHLLL